MKRREGAGREAKGLQEVRHERRVMHMEERKLGRQRKEGRKA